jgi:hypothetical protein
LQKLGKERQQANKQHKRLVEKGLISTSLELEVRKQYRIELTKRFEALENLNDSKDINRVWENIKEIIISAADTGSL